MPLHVSISTHFNRKDSLVVQHSERWQHAFVSFLPKHIVSIFRFPTPLLEVLQVLRIEALPYPYRDATHKVPEESLSPGIVPKLSYPRLIGIYMSLDCLRYSSLTELFLWDIQTHRYPISQLLSVLEASPRIQKVTLWAVAFSPYPNSEQSQPSLISLPYLHKLKLEEPRAWVIRRILSCI